ncbi:AAA family ATPase [Rhodococcus sp. NPDC056960]|uniref:AAA family ATPase n=1 Tax=Rhodococcus sp. NPDC056960 TaxID=3345982 RepID=UPI00363B6884
MSPDPVLHAIAGPNGAGKTTFYELVLRPVTHMDFVNADVIAAARWPNEAATHAYEAAALAAEERAQRISQRRSFVAETVFSHESKLDLLRDAERAGFHVTLHVILIPEELAVARVLDRVANGGHHVPEEKIRARFGRLWDLLHAAIATADHAYVYDNTTAATPFRLVASFTNGHPIDDPRWPSWTPPALRPDS